MTEPIRSNPPVPTERTCELDCGIESFRHTHPNGDRRHVVPGEPTIEVSVTGNGAYIKGIQPEVGEWEKEFDDKFVGAHNVQSWPYQSCNCDDLPNKDCKKDFKAFFRKVLSRRESEWRDRAGRMVDEVVKAVQGSRTERFTGKEKKYLAEISDAVPFRAGMARAAQTAVETARAAAQKVKKGL